MAKYSRLNRVQLVDLTGRVKSTGNDSISMRNAWFGTFRFSRMHPKITQAFTLIELLVVIAIISILASLLVPAVTRALEKGRVTMCISNLRQISVAQRIYLNDHENMFFEYEQDGTGPDREAAQGGIPTGSETRPLNEYAGQLEVWKCPSDKGRERHTNYAVLLKPYKPHIWSQPRAGTSYFFNTFGVPDNWDVTPQSNPYHADTIHNDESLIIRPEVFVLFYEYPFFNVNRFPAESGSGRRVIGAGWGHGGAANFHEPYYEETTANVAFADGHVVYMRDFSGWGEHKDGAYDFITRP